MIVHGEGLRNYAIMTLLEWIEIIIEDIIAN